MTAANPRLIDWDPSDADQPLSIFAPLSLLLLLIGSPPALGAPSDPPDIQINEIERIVRAGAYHDSDEIEDEIVGMEPGPFVESVGVGLGTSAEGSTVDASAQQNTAMDSLSVWGEGIADSTAMLGAGEFATAQGNGVSSLSMNFNIPVEAAFTLTGSLSIIAPTEFAGEATMGFAAFGSRGFIIENEVARSTGDLVTVPFSVSGTLVADQPIQFSIGAYATPDYDDPVGGDSSGAVVAWFNFELVIGDRDGDGLPDSWETDGIDFDGDGQPEIDLPALGADPDHKDIFVEVDVMEGVSDSYFDAMAAMLVQAFAEAPADLVDNPDGEPGIALHLIRDGDRPVNQPLLRYEGDDFLPPEYFSIRENNFGSAADREHDFADAIREARTRIFRYALLADVFTDTTLSGGQTPFGVAHGIPARDFVIAVGTHEAAPSYQNILTEAMASTFMHELGHTLGLQHGGADNLNYKPHYLSVMNYLYGLPPGWQLPSGLDLGALLFRLDYSRTGEGAVLNESELRESISVVGPPGSWMVWNTAPSGVPTAFVFAPTNASSTDWNGNEMPDAGTYALDLNRFAGPNADPSKWNAIHHELVGQTDWDKLIYNTQAPAVAARGGEGVLEREPVGQCIDPDVLEALRSVEWRNLSIPSLIFADGFETGGLQAWQ